MGVEALVNRAALRRHRYRLVDSIANLGCGVEKQNSWVSFSACWASSVTRGVMNAPPDHDPVSVRLFAWVALLFGVDLAYYVYHRASHRVNFIWAAHAVAPPERGVQPLGRAPAELVHQLVEWVFYTPLAVVGFPPAMSWHARLNTLYQFWIHTRAIGQAGPPRVDPQHAGRHRVHHAAEPAPTSTRTTRASSSSGIASSERTEERASPCSAR